MSKHQKSTFIHWKKITFTLCHNWTVTSIKKGRARPNREDGDDIWSMMTDAPLATTLPACIHWLIMAQRWCHSSHCTSSKLSVKLKLLVMVTEIPIDMFLFPTAPALVMSCNNAVQHFQHPLQLFGWSLNKPTLLCRSISFMWKQENCRCYSRKRLLCDQPPCFLRETINIFPLLYLTETKRGQIKTYLNVRYFTPKCIPVGKCNFSEEN